jgi:hypothetical protein
MTSKNEKNYLLDVSLLITGLACLISGILLHIRPEFTISSLTYIRPLHIWIGYVASAIILIHLLMHSSWINSVTKKLFSDKKKALILIGVIIISIIACYAAAVWGPDTQHHQQQRKGKGKMRVEVEGKQRDLLFASTSLPISMLDRNSDNHQAYL